jgi:hypothetical protein
VFDRYPVELEGLRPEQVVIDRARLADWRRSGDADSLKPWRTAALGNCDNRVSLMNWNPRYPGASISERGYDSTVKVWTGRPIDILAYVASSDPVTIRIDGDSDHGRRP